MIKPGIVVCSRLDSSRIPGKPLKLINGIPCIVHLARRLMDTGLPVVIAVPHDDYQEFVKCPLLNGANLLIYPSHQKDDPLARTLEVQQHLGFSHIIRITHDKIFVDTSALKNALELVNLDPKIDYLYSHRLTPGTGFEIMSDRCLEAAHAKYKNVEHLTYAARLVSRHTVNAKLDADFTTFNLLVDFPEDLQLMETLLAGLGNQATLEDVLSYLRKHPKLAYINAPPIVTVYTSAYNSASFIGRCMASVVGQKDFKQMEYIIVDDHSTDSTVEQVAKFAVGKSNVKWYRNQVNKGLASSSNFALARARGKYIVRLDADDYFTSEEALVKLVHHIKTTKSEIVYPNNHFGELNKVQQGNECHHIGGALFDRNALNFIRFTEGLRNYDGLDLFVRAKDKLRISYLEEAIFMYTQRPDSMSKTNLEERARIRSEIEAQA